MRPLLSEIFKSVCAGEDCWLPELKLCSYILNICPYHGNLRHLSPRAAWLCGEAQLTGLTAVLLQEQHSSTSTHWLLQETLLTHSHTPSSPAQLSTFSSRGQTTEHKVHSMHFRKCFFLKPNLGISWWNKSRTITVKLHQTMCSSPLLLPSITYIGIADFMNHN